jgi:hypothetical protein
MCRNGYSTAQVAQHSTGEKHRDGTQMSDNFRLVITISIESIPF